MTGSLKSPGEASTDPGPFEPYFESLLKSALFQASPRRSELLRYLVRQSFSGQGARLSEYAIALEVFQKPESFDQRIDSTVRSEISRLRKMLLNYYAGPGAEDPWRIVFPARGYVPEVSRVLPDVPRSAPSDSRVERDSSAPERISPTQPIFRFRLGRPSVVVLLLVAFIAVFLGLRDHGLIRNLHLSSTHGINEAPLVSTVNPAAKAFYLKGQYYGEHRTRKGLNEAVDAYTQAIVADSNYAEAYAGLASSYELMPEFSSMPQTEAFSRGIAAANRAIALDPSISIAHRALAFGLFWSQTDISRSFREFQEAIRLAPNDAEAHHWYATALNAVGRDRDARREIDIAQQLAPASRSILADQAWIRYNDGDSQAVAKLKELEVEEPDFRSPPDFLARIDLARGDSVDYLEQLRRLAAISKSPADLQLSESASKGWNTGGNRGMLLAIQALQERAFAGDQTDGYDLAHTCALLGEKQQAVKYLQAAFAVKDIFVLDTLRPDWAPQMSSYPPFEGFRQQVRKRFGIGNS